MQSFSRRLADLTIRKKLAVIVGVFVVIICGLFVLSYLGITLLARIALDNEKLTVLEDNFSYTLGELARWLNSLLFNVMLGAVILSLGIGLYIAYVISRRLSGEIHQLRDAANRIAGGDFTPNIE